MRSSVQIDAVNTIIDGRYRVFRELGRGGMGSVHRAEDMHLERPVAIKFGRTDIPWMTSRFRKEAAALAAIRNEHVAAIHAYGEHEGAPFFVMEYIRGENLATIAHQHRKASARVPLYRGVEIICEIAHGLTAAHAAGVIHGDLKTENVVIERGTGRPVLVDFGLSHDSERELKGAQQDEPMLGTPHYMAPEIYWEDGVTPNAASDIYSLAILGYEVLTGVLPFDSPDALTILEMQRDVVPPPLSTYRPELQPLDDLFARSLAKRPEDRPRTVGAFRAPLVAFQRRLAIELASHEGRVSETFGASQETPRIMIVDDEHVFARLATRAAHLAYGEQAVNVISVDSGAEALARARRELPQLVVLDYDLPELNGVDLLSHMRSLPGGEDMEVLVVSGEAGAAERWRFGILGVRDFLEKPVDLVKLISAIGTVSRRRGWLTWDGKRAQTVR